MKAKIKKKGQRAMKIKSKVKAGEWLMTSAGQ